MTLIKEIKEHTARVNKIIPLSIRRFASCSDDCTFKIWKNDDTHECLSTLKHNGKVSSIIQLRNQKVLVSCGHNSSTGISFWNINDYTQQRKLKDIVFILLIR